MSEIEQCIKRKIETTGTPLGEWDIKISRGVLTGCNEAFIIDGATKDRLIAADPKSAEIIRPILRGKDIKRYSYDFKDLWLIASHNGYACDAKQFQPINIDDYPAIKQHLDKYWDQIKNRGDKGVTPYNLRNCAYMDDFSKPKIVFQEMVQEPSFVLDTTGEYVCNDTARIITSDMVSLPALLAIFNSKTFFFAMKCFYAGGGLGAKGIRMKHTFMNNFPMPPKSAIVNIDTVMNACRNKPSDNDCLKIDRILAEAYSFSSDEHEYIQRQAF